MFGQKRRFTVMARDERFVILSKFFIKDKSIYTIVDLKEQWMGPDNLVFEAYDFTTTLEAEKVLGDLETGEIEISTRRGISFDQYRKKYGNS